MDRKRWMNRLCAGALLLVTAAVFTGCLGKKREYVPLSSEAPETQGKPSSGIRIEIISEDEESETELPPEESLAEETEETETEETEPETEETETPAISPGQTSPGDILEKGDIEEAGADAFFTASPIDSSVFKRMDGKSYKEGCPVPLQDLRYLRILYYDFSGNIRVGELVCNQSVSRDMLGIFKRLYEVRYPIEKVRLVDDYGADDDLSSSDNNTSCFNYRTVAGSSSLSLHALGVAIDINPLYNPYITRNAEGETRCAPANGAVYMDRTQDFPYKIDEGDICYRLFVDAGFTWGGSWVRNPDYMHFSRGATPER